MEEALKNKFEGFGDQGEASNFFSICSISKDLSRKQLEGENWLSVGEGHPIADGSLAPTIAGVLLFSLCFQFLIKILIDLCNSQLKDWQGNSKMLLEMWKT
ncbi:hypothetical protein M9H77_35412 [Catharanthus roseus]|uniref:Uncharacterized protein n=1 Tax=Catharanthus roseus TaxID=4058 RepID=A0ACB9ZR35_CATRO|nr:hypothetical protein M9H77_35412 [Catharanthus roseus]